MIFPPCSLIQYALPKLFEAYDENYYQNINSKLYESAKYIYSELVDIKGIQPIKTSAGMFMMVRIKIEELKVKYKDLTFIGY